MPIPLIIIWSLVFILLAIFDWKKRRLPNWIIYPALVAAIPLSIFYPVEVLKWSWPVWANGIIGGVFAFAVFMVLKTLVIKIKQPDALGWGDVKMAALVGVVTGFPVVLLALGFAFMAGMFLNVTKRARKEGIPFGTALSAGAIISIIGGIAAISWFWEKMAGLLWIKVG